MCSGEKAKIERKTIPRLSEQFFKLKEKIDKIRGSLKNPLFCLLHSRVIALKGLGRALVVLIGVAILGTSLILNFNEKKETFFEAKVSSSLNIQKPFLTQGEQKKESPDLSLIQNSALVAAAPPVMVTSQVLGALTEGGFGVEGSFGGERKEIIEYRVEAGDTLSGIAADFEISLNTLLWANELSKSSTIQPGQKLLILPISGVLYHVETGDTLSEIAQIYKGKTEEIIALNELPGEENIYPGDIIIIPGGEMPVKLSQVKYSSAQVPLTSNYFLCPIPLVNGQCRITQGLHYYNAIDFGTEGFSCGQPVYAAASGEVLKVKYGYNFGAGNYIRVLHSNGIITHYGHLAKILANVGQKVFRGDIIGLVGYSGFTLPSGPAGCHLHFGVYSASGPPPLNPFAK